MIGFWESKDLAFRTSTVGLTVEQVEWLQALSVGDRLVLLKVDEESPSKFPDFWLQKVEK